MRSLYVLVLAAACGGAQHPRPTTGAIGGLARDHESGDPIAKAQIRVRAEGQQAPTLSVTGANGAYELDHLAPGRYTLSALFAGQPIEVSNVTVRPGEITVVDVTFTLGQPDPIRVDYGDPKDSEIDHYHPRSLAPGLAVIEGTVNDLQTRARVDGAVVMATGGPNHETIQTVSNGQGRYRFDPVAPGTYEVSAYYTIDGHGQIEVRRSDIKLAAGEAAIVPMWVELTKL